MLVSLTVANQSFYAGHPVMSTFGALWGLTLQQNQVFLCPLQMWSFHQVNLCLASLSSAWTNGKTNGTATKVKKSFIVFITLLALSNIAKYLPLWFGTHYQTELVIVAYLTHTYCPPTCQSRGLPLTVKHILVECSLPSFGTCVKNILLSLLLETCLRALTSILGLLLILLKKPILSPTVIFIYYVYRTRGKNIFKNKYIFILAL